MIRTTPFHERTEAANATGLWSHWAGQLVAEKYQMAEKFEYFAIRNAVGVFDTSPLYKYRISGRDAERYLAGVLTRDIRKCRPGTAQYTLWCDGGGYVIEDGVILRRSGDEFLLATARPNLAYFSDLIFGSEVAIDDVSDDYAVLAIQGPKSRAVLASLSDDVADLGYFHTAETKLADLAVTVSRTGFTGDLGYEVWVDAPSALDLWDAVMEAGAGYGILPVGQIALLMARIEAGLLLLDVDFKSSRYAWTDADRSTPDELGLGWMARDASSTDRAFIGRDAIVREQARWSTVGIVVDWADWDALHDRNGLVPPKDHVPVDDVSLLYDSARDRVGYVTSFMYSPMMQRHIGIARVRPELSAAGTEVTLEVTINHEWQSVKAHVAGLPFYNPPRKLA